MIEEQRKKKNLFVAVGLAGLVGGLVVQLSGEKGSAPYILGFLIRLAGFGAFLYGCICYARAKGRHWAWGLLGFFNLFGLAALWLLLKDKSAELPEPSTDEA